MVLCFCMTCDTSWKWWFIFLAEEAERFPERSTGETGDILKLTWILSLPNIGHMCYLFANNSTTSPFSTYQPLAEKTRIPKTTALHNATLQNLCSPQLRNGGLTLGGWLQALCREPRQKAAALYQSNLWICNYLYRNSYSVASIRKSNCCTWLWNDNHSISCMWTSLETFVLRPCPIFTPFLKYGGIAFVAHFIIKAMSQLS